MIILRPFFMKNNLNVIVKNEPLRETNGAEAQVDTSPD